MTQLILCAVAGVTGLGVISLVKAYQGAVDGYQDAEGFHVGDDAVAVIGGDLVNADGGLPPVVCG